MKEQIPKMSFSIIVPCYNEKENIPLLLNKFNEVINAKDIEIILVDNGSTDGSRRLIQGLLANYKWAKLVSIDNNIGYGNGIKAGLRSSTGDYIGWTHADLQTDPLDVIKAIDWIRDNKYNSNIIVKGKRQNRRLTDRIFTIGMAVFESIVLGVKLSDINAQPNIIHRSLYTKALNPPDDFSLDLYYYYLSKKLNYKEIRIPVKFPERIHGSSKWNIDWKSKVRFIARTVQYSYRLKDRLTKEEDQNLK